MTDDAVERLKAHLVANAMRQIEGMDYHEMFVLVIKS